MKKPANNPQKILIFVVPWDIIQRNATQCGAGIKNGVEKNPRIPIGVQ